MTEKFSPKIFFILFFCLIIQNSLYTIFIPISPVYGEQYEREFNLNNETKVFLDEENTQNQNLYNGSIRVTLFSGGPIDVTVNDQEESLSLGQTQKFLIINSTKLFFQISVENTEAEGVFRVNLELVQPEPDRQLGLIFLLVGGGIMLIAVGYFYLQRKRSMTKPDADQEPVDEEVRKKRQEAAAAERRYWGKD
ncbi:MAG: hypothetical protein GF308_05625 [Candidatus Heimdallarchaeota archaeon]|nr:hypothetical protein [Candidatus Heimdallarchaeota archaeon]